MIDTETDTIITELARYRFSFLSDKYSMLGITFNKTKEELIEKFLNPQNSMDYVFKHSVLLLLEARKKNG